MAVATLLALLDDMAALMDDVAAMTKVAAKKTAGVLGDDLAVNAEKVLGVRPERELAVVWAVAKGSAVNKVVLVPVALMISLWLPWLITPLLVCGGLYLCFEGAEKLLHGGQHSDASQRATVLTALAKPDVDMATLERDKIRGAIRTDFILSAEIIVLTLGIVDGQSLQIQLVVLAGIASLMTVGVYSLVAAIVKLDDLGMVLQSRGEDGMWGRLVRGTGSGLLAFAPILMRTLSVVGTGAMFLVGGGILLHAWPTAAHGIEVAAAALAPWGALLPTLAGGVIGLVVGVLLVKLQRLNPFQTGNHRACCAKASGRPLQ